MMDHSNKIVDKKDRKLALVIVDVQKKFIVNAKDTTLESARVHTPVIQKAISMFREAGRPVIWILYDAKAYMEGITEETTSLLDGFEFVDTDRIVMKYHMNSFNNTNLSDIVESYGCDSVLLCGMFAQYCVMSTYWGAFDKDLSPYMLKDGLISTDDKFCNLAFGLCKSYDLEELEENLSLNRMK